MRKMSGALRGAGATEGAPLFSNQNGYRHTVAKPDRIVDLERRQQSLEDEIASALLQCSTDNPFVADLKRRMFHLRDELERLRHQAFGDLRLH